jgi:hypothetical protein
MNSAGFDKSLAKGFDYVKIFNKVASLLEG